MNPLLGGQFTFPGTSLTVQRLGYGAMQLAGPGVWGPPKDPEGAVAVLREAVAAGVNHIDTSDFYGPHITNQIIRQALHPYPAGLVLWLPKLGRGAQPMGRGNRLFRPRSWPKASMTICAIWGWRRSTSSTTVRWERGAGHGPAEGSIAEGVTALAELKSNRGLSVNIGLSNVTATQVAEAQAITDIVCVQNQYNLVQREDDALVDDLARTGHSLRAVFSSGRVYTVAVVHPIGYCGPIGSYADAGRLSVVAAPVAQHLCLFPARRRWDICARI